MYRKISYILTAALCLGLAACSDQNDAVRDLIDEIENRPVVKQLEYTLTTADYAAISKTALEDAGDDAAKKALANAVRSTNSLNSFATGDKYIPAVLKAAFPALGLESAIQVTYAYTPDYLAGLTSNPPAAELEVMLEERFETGYAARERWDKNGWTQIVTKGGKYWDIRSYNNNLYAQATAYNGAAEDMEAYMVSPAITIDQPSDNNFSFDVCVGSWNYAGLSVLITEDAGAATDPASVSWTNVTGRFSIPTTPTSGYGTMGPAGTMNLDSYAGKTIRIAFRYEGRFVAQGSPDNRTTTFQIDNVLVANGRIIVPGPGEVYINDPAQGGWVLLSNGVALIDADYAAMGVSSLTAATAPGYLPAFLAQKFPYAQQGDRKAVLYGTTAEEYVYTGGKWSSTLVGAPLTEQYVNDGTKWIFDPTVQHTMTKADYQLVVDHFLADPALAVYVSSYKNDEWYYGFNSYRDNVNLRVVGGTSNHNNANSAADTELHALDGNLEAQIALLWERLEQKGMPLFLSLKYPNSPAIAQGVQLYYNITVLVFSPDGETQTSRYYMMRYKVLTPGAGSANPPTFEFVSKEDLGTSL